MSDREWDTSQGVNFDANPIPSNQQIGLSEQPITNLQTTNSSEKQQVTISRYINFGQRTLGGLTLIILTVSLQLFLLLINALQSSNGGTTTVGDFENAMQLQFWFAILTIIAQLVGMKLIYDDVRNLSHSLNDDVDVRNSNLNIITKILNKK